MNKGMKTSCLCDLTKTTSSICAILHVCGTHPPRREANEYRPGGRMRFEIVRHPSETTSSSRVSVILIHPNEKRTRIVHFEQMKLWISRPPSPLSLAVAAFLFLSQRDGKKISIAAATERTISRSLPGRTDGREGRQGIPRDTTQAFLGHPLELRTGFWNEGKRRLQH